MLPGPWVTGHFNDVWAERLEVGIQVDVPGMSGSRAHQIQLRRIRRWEVLEECDSRVPEPDIVTNASVGPCDDQELLAKPGHVGLLPCPLFGVHIGGGS